MQPIRYNKDECFLGHIAFSRHCQSFPQSKSHPAVKRRKNTLQLFDVTDSVSFCAAPQMASSTLLQLGQNVERVEVKNRESIYLLLHMVGFPVQYCSCILKFTINHKWVYNMTNGKFCDSVIEFFFPPLQQPIKPAGLISYLESTNKWLINTKVISEVVIKHL